MKTADWLDVVAWPEFGLEPTGSDLEIGAANQRSRPCLHIQ
jgi:hypothetical protein